MKKLLFGAAGVAILVSAGGASAAGFRFTADGGVVKASPTAALEAPTVALTAALAASSPHTTIGAATANADGSVLLDSSKGPAGISLSIPRWLSVGDVTDFSTDYSFASGCGNGVPQLVLVTVRGPLIVSLGSAANFSCSSGVKNSSSFLKFGTPADTGRILAGTFTDTWGHAKSEYDHLLVTDILFTTSGANQSVTVSNFQLILNVRPPEPSM